MAGPLIWITIAHEILPLATMLKQTLKQDLIKLNLAQLDDHNKQVYMTSLSKMKDHPSAAILQPFVTNHTNYRLHGTLSRTFLKLVSQAEHLVSLTDLDI
jgi:hypothetical protein